MMMLSTPAPMMSPGDAPSPASRSATGSDRTFSWPAIGPPWKYVTGDGGRSSRGPPRPLRASRGGSPSREAGLRSAPHDGIDDQRQCHDQQGADGVCGEKCRLHDAAGAATSTAATRAKWATDEQRELGAHL